MVEDKSLTDKIYQELMDGLKTKQDYTHLRAKYDASKSSFYNALGRLIRDMEPKVREFSEVQAKVDTAGLKLDSLDQQIKEAEGSLTPLEERKSSLNEQIETLETKVAEKSELLEHAGELAKLGFDTEILRQLREALTEIGAKQGLKGKEAVSKFFEDLKDYEAVLEAESLLKGLQNQIETNKLEAKKWQAEEEALRRKHDDLKEVIRAVYAFRAKGIKDNQIIAWQRVLNQVESVEQFDEHLRQYGDITNLLNARKEEVAACQLRLTKAQSQAEILEKERARIEARIDALKVAGVKQLEAMTEATGKQLKAVAAGEIREARAVGQEVRTEFANYFAQLDKLLEKAVHLGQEVERSKQELQSYEGVKDTLQAVAAETEK